MGASPKTPAAAAEILTVERQNFPVVYRDRDLVGVWTFGEGVRLGRQVDEFDLRTLGTALLTPYDEAIMELFVRTASGNIYRFESDHEQLQIQVSNANSDQRYTADAANPLALFSYTGKDASSWMVRRAEQIGIGETVLTSAIEEIVAVSSFVVYAGKSLTALRQAVDRYTSRELNLVRSEYLQRKTHR